MPHNIKLPLYCVIKSLYNLSNIYDWIKIYLKSSLTIEQKVWVFWFLWIILQNAAYQAKSRSLYPRPIVLENAKERQHIISYPYYLVITPWNKKWRKISHEININEILFSTNLTFINYFWYIKKNRYTTNLIYDLQNDS